MEEQADSENGTFQGWTSWPSEQDLWGEQLDGGGCGVISGLKRVLHHGVRLRLHWPLLSLAASFLRTLAWVVPACGSWLPYSPDRGKVIAFHHSTQFVFDLFIICFPPMMQGPWCPFYPPPITKGKEKAWLNKYLLTGSGNQSLLANGY